MRTTVDIPEDLLRRAKAAAALRGSSLKDFVTDAIRQALRTPADVVAEGEPAYGDEQVVGEDCVFPLIRGAAGPALRDLTPERVHEILEEEEVGRVVDRVDGSR